MKSSSSAGSIPFVALNPVKLARAMNLAILSVVKQRRTLILNIFFPIYESLGIKGVTFFDVGNAWSSDDVWGEDDTAFASWRYSAGTGIRWMSPLGPMRFEYGWNLDARDYENNGKFDFMIGRFF